MELRGKGHRARALPGVRPFSRVTAHILGKGRTAYTPHHWRTPPPISLGWRTDEGDLGGKGHIDGADRQSCSPHSTFRKSYWNCWRDEVFLFNWGKLDESAILIDSVEVLLFSFKFLMTSSCIVYKNIASCLCKYNYPLHDAMAVVIESFT